MKKSKEMPKQADIIMSVYSVVEKYRELFELGSVLLIAAIIMLFLPWLSNNYDPNKMRIGLFIVAGISCTVLCFLSIPCFILSHSSPENTENQDEGTSHEVKESTNDRFYAYICALLSFSTLSPLTCCGISQLFEHYSEINVIWLCILPLWVVVCSLLGYQVWKRIGENLS